MPSVCFYFQVHQPLHLRHYTVFDQGEHYFDYHKNAFICRKVANKCYLPANRLLLKIIRRWSGKFKIAYNLTGVLLEQLQRYSPEVISTFDALAETGCVEFLAETYYHSLRSLYSRDEFIEQVSKHIDIVGYLFGQRPRVFRSTKLIYNNDLATLIESMGIFDAIITEGEDLILGPRSPNFIYRPKGCSRLKLLLKHHSLSDDISFRLFNRKWSEWPLTAEKFARWISNTNGNVINLIMDYETLSEHLSDDTGMFEFISQLPEEILKHSGNDFKTPSEVAQRYEATDTVDVPQLITSTDDDSESDLSAWLGNAMQSSTIDQLYRLEKVVKQTGDEKIIAEWRRLQASDYFYYMYIKHLPDGDALKYRNGDDSLYDSYINFTNVLNHLRSRCLNAITEGGVPNLELKNESAENLDALIVT